ncbi:MAG: hypothetical protein MHM6MM_003758 [Cercozoa sp. M6MM]
MPLVPVKAPIAPEQFESLWKLLILIGLLSAAAVFVYGSAVSRRKRSLVLEIVLVLVASISAGFGSLLLFLDFGLWV